MPTYEYECNNCHHNFSIMQKITDAAIKKCPQCAAEACERLISAAGFQLKGTGWYVTDFKNKEAAKPASLTQKETPANEVKPTTPDVSAPKKEAEK